MAFETFDAADNLPAVETKLDTNAAKSQALLNGVGIPEDGTTIGTLAGTTGDLASGDTVKEGLEKTHAKANAAIAGEKLRHDSDSANRASRDLGQDVDLDGLTDGTVGTTFMPAGGTNVAQYPQGNTLYEVDVRRSGDVTGSAFNEGDLLTYTLTAEVGGEAYRWVATDLSGGGRSDWSQLAPVETMTGADANRTLITLANDADWLGSIASGHYQVTYTAANANGSTMPVPSLTEARTWQFTIFYATSTTGWVIATAAFDLDGLGTKPHRYAAALTRSGGDWAAPTWVGLTAEDVADRTIRPNQLLGGDWTLTQPTEVTASFLGLPRKTAMGYACTTSALLNQPTVAAGTYYCDIVNGDDATGDGSDPDTPYKTPLAALVDNADCGTLYIAPGHYGYPEGITKAVDDEDAAGAFGSSPISALKVLAWQNRPGEVILSTSHWKQADWVKTSGRTFVYEREPQFAADSGQFNGVVDLNHRDGNGGFLKYAEVGSIGEVDDQPGTYFCDYTDPPTSGTGICYVHTPTGVAPTIGNGDEYERILGLRGTRALGDSTGTKVIDWFVDGMTLIGGSGGFDFKNTSGTLDGVIVIRRTRAVNCGSAGFKIEGALPSLLEDCEALNNDADGFQYFDEGDAGTTVTELRCRGLWNRGSQLTTGNGSSAHDDARVLRINGEYAHNTGPQIADINDAQSWNVGCIVGPAAADDILANNHAGIFVNDDAVMSCVDCIAQGSYRDIAVVDANARIYVDASTIYTTWYDDGDADRIQAYVQT